MMKVFTEAPCTADLGSLVSEGQPLALCEGTNAASRYLCHRNIFTFIKHSSPVMSFFVFAVARHLHLLPLGYYAVGSDY